MGIFKNIGKSIKSPFNRINTIIKQVAIAKIGMDALIRPQSGDLFSGNVHAYPKFPYQGFELYNLAFSSDTLTSIHNALRRELFRNGFALTIAENLDEEDTSSEEEVEPTGKTRKRILDKLENINENKQTLLDVLMELEDDFSIRDDAFMLLILKYAFDTEGDIIPEETVLSQVIRMNPMYVGLVINKYDRPAFNDDNIPLYVCPVHRNNLLEDTDRCHCGLKAFPAYFFSDYGDSKIYYSSREVIHKSKYRPSKRFGYSPVMSTWQKVRTLLFMDKYIMQLYDGQRPPKAGLFFKTSNQDGLKKSWAAAKQQAREEPHLPIVMGIPDSSNGQGFVEFIDFMKSLDELQHVDMRNEFRRQIGSVYGVEPIFQGDNSNSGGLNNEGLQITVTNRAVEYGQRIYNRHYFPKILEAMKVKGWILELNPSEEQDEMAKLTRQAQTLANGQLALNLGLTATYDEKLGEVIIEKGSLERIEVPEEGGFDANPLDNPADFVSGAPAPKTKVDPRPPFTKLSDTLKKEIDKFLKKFKKRPTEQELQKEIVKINFSLQAEMNSSIEKFFKKTYQAEAEKISKSLGVNAVFDLVDENALNVLSKQTVLSNAFAGISDNVVGKLKGIIEDAYRNPAGLSTEKITERIKEVSNIADHKAENIARTETSKVSSAARKASYSKEEGFDNFLFKWIGPEDNRTTGVSKRIKSRTNKGVTWSNLIDIISEESIKEFPKWRVDKEFPVSHYQSRHTFIKISDTTKSREIEKNTKERVKNADIELDFIIKKKEIDILNEKENLIKKLSGDLNEGP